MTGSVKAPVSWILRAEGLALMALALWAYSLLDGNWVRFALLFFVPDLSFVSYAISPRVGAISYNCLHSTIGPAILAALAHGLGMPQLYGIAALWFAHVGFDRALGYGLKYAEGFGFTHLGLIGRARRSVAG